MAVRQSGKVLGRVESGSVAGDAKVAAVVGGVGRKASVDARQPLRQAADPHQRELGLRGRRRLAEGDLSDP